MIAPRSLFRNAIGSLQFDLRLYSWTKLSVVRNNDPVKKNLELTTGVACTIVWLSLELCHFCNRSAFWVPFTPSVRLVDIMSLNIVYTLLDECLPANRSFTVDAVDSFCQRLGLWSFSRSRIMTHITVCGSLVIVLLFSTLLLVLINLFT